MQESGRGEPRPRRGRLLLGVVLALALPIAAWFTPAGTEAVASRAVDTPIDEAAVAELVAARWAPRGVTYRVAARSDGSQASLALDVHSPPVDVTGPRPVVVVLHPGGFSFGDRTDPGTVVLAEEFAARGYVAIAADYRTRPDWGFTMDDEVTLAAAVSDARDDVIALLGWIDDHAPALGVDPSRVAVVGRSAGAMTALAVAGDDVSAVVSSAGCWVGGPQLTSASAPALLIHGADDTVVPPACADATVEAARANGEEVELVSLPGVWHEATDAHEQWWGAVDRFFDTVGLTA